MGINGCDSVRVCKEDVKLALAKSTNISMGRQADGSLVVDPMFTSTDGALMTAVAGPTFWSRRGEIFKSNYQWYNSAGHLENVSRGRYFVNNLKAQFGSWGNFNNLNWVTDKIQTLEGYAQKTGKAGRRYRNVLKQFQNAQKSMQMTGQLPSGMTFDKLSKAFADVRLAENTAILKPSSKAGVWAKTCARSSRWIKKGMVASKGMRTFSRVTGKFGGPVAIIATCATLGLEVFTAASAAKTGEGWKDAGRQLVKSGIRAGAELGGAWAGMKLGAAIGGCLGPVGAVVGGLVGSIAGWAIGSWAANKSEFVKTSVVEENQMAEVRKQMASINEALEKGDLNELANFLAGAYEYNRDDKGQIIPAEDGSCCPNVVTDANGKPILDANGSQIAKIQKVTENEELQKEYEKLIRIVEQYMTQAAATKTSETDATGDDLASVGYGSGSGSTGYQYGVGSTGNSLSSVGYGSGSGSTGYRYGIGSTGNSLSSIGYGSVPRIGINTNFRYNPSEYGLADTRYSFSNNYSNFAYNFDNGRYDYMNTYNPLMMNYNNNIFAQKTEQ